MKRAKHQRKVPDQFTRRWKTDYLLSLRKNRAVDHTESEPIKIDDIVLLKDDNTPRIFWKFTVVQELIKGKDGHVRNTKVKVLNNSGKPVLLTRSISHLIPLEVHSTLNSTSCKKKQSVISDVEKRETDNFGDRPRRTAATIGELLRRERR